MSKLPPPLFKILNDINSVEARTWFQIVNENRPNTRAINSDHGVISFQIPVKRTELSRNVFSVRAAKFWNDLPVHVKKAVTLSTFKKRLDIHIQTLAYLFRPLTMTLLGFLRV